MKWANLWYQRSQPEATKGKMYRGEVMKREMGFESRIHYNTPGGNHAFE